MHTAPCSAFMFFFVTLYLFFCVCVTRCARKVDKAKEEFKVGNLFEVVLSQTFKEPCTSRSVLRVQNVCAAVQCPAPLDRRHRKCPQNSGKLARVSRLLFTLVAVPLEYTASAQSQSVDTY